MTDNFIHLKKDNIIRIGIKDADGNDTGEHLEFDLEDIDLPLRYQECDNMHRKNIQDIKMRLSIINKKEDKKGKKMLSLNEEEKIKAIKEFYKKEMDALDLFLGDGGTKKLLNGRKPYYTMYDDINETLEPIMPIIKKGFDNIEEKIKNKYSIKRDNNVLE